MATSTISEEQLQHNVLKVAAASAAPSAVTPNQLNSVYLTADIEKLYLDSSKRAPSVPYKYESLRPAFPNKHWAPLKPFDYQDVGLRANPELKELLSAATAVEHLTPKTGTVLHGIQLSQLTNVQKDQLARLIAYRGVVFFRKQDDFSVKQQLELGRYWGPLHPHAVTAVPRGAEEDPELLDVHIVWADEKKIPTTAFTQTYLWHSDVSYEEQPPAYTSFKLLQVPPTGGDTLWTSGYALYDSLSSGLQKYLEALEATHSAFEQAEDMRQHNLPVRRDPIITRHPLVRTHPVTGYKSVFANPGFTRAIVGVSKDESDAILNLLYNLIATNVEATVRWKWEPEDVAIWDNRCTVHSPSYGFFPHRRHAARVTVRGEKPYFDPKSASQQGTIDKELGIKTVIKDATIRGNYGD